MFGCVILPILSENEPSHKRPFFKKVAENKLSSGVTLNIEYNKTQQSESKLSELEEAGLTVSLQFEMVLLDPGCVHQALREEGTLDKAKLSVFQVMLLPDPELAPYIREYG